MKNWIQEYPYAIQQIIDGNYQAGFERIAKGFQAGYVDDTIIEQLYYGFVEPNLLEMQEQFRKNQEFLVKYPYLFTKQLQEPQGISDRFLLFPITETNFYYYDTKEKQFTSIIVNSTVETEYFFHDLSKPLFLENEWNVYNIQFLVDNLRDSMDFAGDNHLYLYYDSIELFSVLLCYCDIQKVCEKQKIVFLIGEEEKVLYPLNSQQYFDVDYGVLEPTPIRLEEVKRVVSFLSVERHCGNAMIDSLFDFHDSLLTIKEFAISEFEQFYEQALKGRTVIQFLDEFIQNQNGKQYQTFLTFFQKIYRISNSAIPDINDFAKALVYVLQEREIPTDQEWFIAFFLANSMALGRNMNSRMVPPIFHAPHIVWGCDWEKGVGYFSEFYKKFPYYKIFGVLRRKESRIGGLIKYEYNSRRLYQMRAEEYYDYFIEQCGPMRNLDWRRAYYGEDDFCPYEQMAYVRFEDIKRYPKETLGALCEFLNIPWSEALLACTHNGMRTTYQDAGTVIDDFDLAPLADDYYAKYLNTFDRFRIEVLYSKFYETCGYQPKYYNGYPYTKDEIRTMMKLPFQLEQLEEGEDLSKAREKMEEQLEELLLYLEEWEEKVKQGQLVPCHMINPQKTQV